MTSKQQQAWQLSRPAELNDLRSIVQSEQPWLHCFEQDGLIWITGSYDLRDDGVLWERFQIRVCLPEDYPAGVPTVWETGGRIPQLADRHVLSNGALCLFAPNDREWVWPTGADFRAFLNGPLRDYFVSQVHFEQYGQWPFGERSHGPQGWLEVYRDRLGISNLGQLEQCFFIISRTEYRGHFRCPCGSRRRLRDCHAQDLLALRRHWSRPQALQMWTKLRNDRQAHESALLRSRSTTAIHRPTLRGFPAST